MTWRIDVSVLIETSRAGGFDPARTARFRELVEPCVIERLTTLTTDRDVIDAALDEAFDRFCATFARTPLDWQVYLMALAFAAAADRSGQTAWVDSVSATCPGDVLERRVLVFAVMLMLDRECEYRLLAAVAGGLIAVLSARACRERLADELRNILAPPRST